ncbi:MAG: tRNA-dihydrouridine synthase family protein [Sedimentisphaerales bacterium]|nr:tRNA-dihydrouridine synthase family protein [Sedimentisphaerales bacterium]
MKLGTITLDVPFFQAALSGYSDQAMRLLAMEHGAPLVFSGLMLDKSVLYPGVLREPLYAVSDREHPIGGQLLGNDPDTMAKAAARLSEFGYDLIDLNFACPAPKVTQKQRGGFLLTDPKRAIEIIRRVRLTVKCPVLVKLRIGYDQNEESLENFWRICEQAVAEGVDGLVIHGRTVTQKYRSRADWSFISRVKGAFPQTTVVGSGDVFLAEDIVERLTEYDIDGVLVARGAIGNPWLFREARALIAGRTKPAPPGLTEQGRLMIRHFDLIRNHYPPSKATLFFRKFCVYYCRRHPQRKKAQMALVTAGNAEDVRSAIEQWYNL